MWMLAGWAFGAGNNAACYNASAAQESCQIRDVSGFSIISPQSPAPASDHEVETPTVEEVLKHGLDQLELSPTHIVVRGTGQSDSIRCEWHGVARTTDHREDTIRYWLGLDDNDDLPSPSDAKTRFMTYVDGMSPKYQETWAANLDALAKGGMTNDILFLACYIDYTTQEYILGSGSGPITVGYDQIAESTSFELYSRAHAAGEFRNESLMSEGEYQAHLNQIAVDAETLVDDIIGGHETVVFLAPMGSHGNITVEAWQAVAQWDLQEDDDEVVHAVRFGTSADDPEHTQTLTNLTTRVTTAAASDSFADERIASPTGLTQEYRDIGAYGDITPDDGSTDTFTPGQPPPMPTCASGTAVASPGTDRGLVHDCGSLLAAKSTLAGTATLNWGKTTASTSWDGVTISGTPSRVTGLALASKSLNGTIPPDLGELFEITTLNLSNNQLTGAIPGELEWLHNLTELRLTGNQLTGCIPVALEDVATNDLSSLSLLYCQPPPPENLAVASPMEYSLSPSWDAVSNTTKYQLEYRPAGVGEWTVNDESLTVTSDTIENLPCDAEYQLRVSAYGSGTTYTAAWSEESPAVSASTAECVSPVFIETPYEFSILENAAVGASVGTVSATEPTDDDVTYSITAGNEAGKFSIGSTSGGITLAASLDYDTQSSYSLTVKATDNAGDMATTSVEIAVLPQVIVAFGQAEYSVAEDAATGIDVTVVLSADAGRDVTVPITTSYQGGATSEDHVTLASSVMFSTGETTKTLQVVPVDDTVVDNGESIVFSFGTLPEGVTAGTPATATVSIDDDEVPPPVTLWTATMTVGNSGGYLGYSTRTGSPAGSLTDDNFTWEGTTYTVTNILYNMYSDRLVVDFSTALTGDADGLALHFGDVQVAFEDAGNTNRQPSWYPLILDWDEDDTVEVSLVYTASQS